MSFICSSCIDDLVLKKIVELASTTDNPCEYCESVSSVEIEFIAEKCDEVLAAFYDVSSLTDASIVYDYEPEGEDLLSILSDLLGSPANAIDDIYQSLIDKWYDRDSDYQQYGDDPWFILKTSARSPISHDWVLLEKSLRTEGRFLNSKVAVFMDEIFGDLANDHSEKQPVLVSAGPNTNYEMLFRARVFQSEKSLCDALCHPERFLGAPDIGVGASGRMNPAGQPAFYGATDVSAALSEVRPPVGSSVVVSKFSIDRPLALLDLRLLGRVTLPSDASFFDSKTVRAAHRRDFLRMLCKEMTMPVLPEAQEKNYLVTQVVASYLATHPRTNIDGIIYPSVQNGETEAVVNIALFYKAARTKSADSTKPTAHVELWEVEEDHSGRYFYPQIEFFNSPSPLARAAKYHLEPQPTLSLVRDSIEIHKIQSISISSLPTIVSVVP